MAACLMLLCLGVGAAAGFVMGQLYMQWACMNYDCRCTRCGRRNH